MDKDEAENVAQAIRAAGQQIAIARGELMALTHVVQALLDTQSDAGAIRTSAANAWIETAAILKRMPQESAPMLLLSAQGLLEQLGCVAPEL